MGGYSCRQRMILGHPGPAVAALDTACWEWARSHLSPFPVLTSSESSPHTPHHDRMEISAVVSTPLLEDSKTEEHIEKGWLTSGI